MAIITERSVADPTKLTQTTATVLSVGIATYARMDPVVIQPRPRRKFIVVIQTAVDAQIEILIANMATGGCRTTNAMTEKPTAAANSAEPDRNMKRRAERGLVTACVAIWSPAPTASVFATAIAAPSATARTPNS